MGRDTSFIFKMKLESVLLAFVCFSNWTFQHVIADPMSSEEHSDVDEVHLKTRGVLDMNTRSRRDAPDMQMETNWNVPDVTKGTYEDADWHPLTSVLEAHFDQTPDSPEVTHSNNFGTDNHGPNQTLNQTIGASATQCGEYSSQLTPNGRCRLMAKLPPVGTTEKRCPDMFRCTDDISFWLHENQNRKEQLKELRETVSELQEELRNHRHRVKVLELQVEDNVRINSTLKERLQFLELRYIETETLLQVHGALLHELQAQLRNLSASVQHMAQNMGCTINVIRAPPPLSMRDALPPGGHHVSYCPSDCASLYHSGVHRSGVYTIVMSPTITFPVYCDMETDGGGWTIFQRRRDGSVSFNRGWSEYRNGFGEPEGEHWLGNQHLHMLSSQGHYSLRIDMQDWSHAHKHALYRSFRYKMAGWLSWTVRSQFSMEDICKLRCTANPHTQTSIYSLTPITLWSTSEKKEPRPRPVVVQYVVGVSEKLRRLLSKHNVPVAFKPQNTLRQRLVHPKDPVPRCKQSNIVYAVQCQEGDQSYIRETKQPLAKRMDQHRRSTSSGQDSVVYTHLQASSHSGMKKFTSLIERNDGLREE